MADTLNVYDNSECRTPILVCKERAGKPGGGKGILIGEDKTFTLSTMQQDTVCYPINTMVATRGGKDDMRTTFGVGEQGDPQYTISAAHCHAVCFQLCGDRNNPSVSVSENAYCIPANPMSDRGQAVCYSIENHPNDSRVKIREDGTVQTLSARCGTGGGNTPCALICCDAVRRIQGNAPDPESVRRRSRGGLRD